MDIDKIAKEYYKDHAFFKNDRDFAEMHFKEGAQWAIEHLNGKTTDEQTIYYTVTYWFDLESKFATKYFDDEAEAKNFVKKITFEGFENITVKKCFEPQIIDF